jgi:hypothetical protein
MQRRLVRQILFLGFWLAGLSMVQGQQLPLALPYDVPGVSYSEAIPTPEDVIGHTIGSTHTRPDQIVDYFETVAGVSDRVTFAEYGRTFENRPLVYAVVTSPANHRQLDRIRLANHSLSDRPADVSDSALERMPVIINTHFSVHGNEASGSEAAILLLYHLAAGRGDRVDDMLDSMVVIIDPCVNPDGRNRFVTWVNSRRGGTPTSDPNDIEHSEPWPGGRTNHYWFDLNRDWLPVQQPESKARLALFHDWRPQVLLDVHEMGSDRTFFFQPGVPSRTNPNTPQEAVDLTEELTQSSGRALDAIGSLYYTKETYDDFYYGKGSTFPDINGGIGILFEQASSRSLVRETDDGFLDYGFTIRNQLAASIGLLEGAGQMRLKLLRHQRDFYAEALDEAASAGFDGWLIGSAEAHTRTQELVDVLRQHRIEVRPVKSETTVDAKTFGVGESYLIPARQPQYRLIESSMETATTFADSIFYDVSTWTLPLAFGVPVAEFNGNPEHIARDPVTDFRFDGGRVVGGMSRYAYVMPWGRYFAPRALYELMDSGLAVRVAMASFEAPVDGETVYFDRGAIIIPLHGRDRTGPTTEAELYQLVQLLAARNHVEFYSLDSGLTPAGIDIGSPRSVPIHLQSIGLIADGPLSAYRVGEAWHLLTERMDIPISLLDWGRIGKIDLSSYDVLILPDGKFDKEDATDVVLRSWVERGGRLIAVQRAAEWAVQTGIVSAEFEEEETPERAPWIHYGDRETVKQAREISGAILQVDLDPSHPISFGLGNRLAVFKTRHSVLKPSIEAGTTVAVYRPSPLLSGYAPTDRLEQLSATAAIASHKVGDGRVVLAQDSPTFRAFWYGTDLLLLNMILFSEAY